MLLLCIKFIVNVYKHLTTPPSLAKRIPPTTHNLVINASLDQGDTKLSIS